MAQVTELLQGWSRGEPEALNAVVEAVYPKLKSLAEAQLRREWRGQTIEATALVHELYLRLSRERGAQLADRVHFFSLAAFLMRRILIDRARRSLASRRQHVRVPLHAEIAWVDAASLEIADFDSALRQLSEKHPAAARTIELRFVLGMTSEETADVLATSKATVERQTRFGKAWLFDRLKQRVEQEAG